MKSFRLVSILPLVVLFLQGCGKTSPEESFEEAVRLMQQQNFVSARHRFEEIAKDHPDFEYINDVRLAIADCFNFEQKPDDAEVIYKEIAQKNPKTLYSWKAGIRLGEMARIEKKYDESETWYRAAIEDVTEEGPKLTAMNSLVRTYQEAGKIDASIETLRQMLALAENSEFRMRIGIQLVNVLISQNKKDDAWQVLTSLYNPKDPEDTKESFFLSLIQAVPAMGKFQETFHYLDGLVASATDDESRARASFFNGLLASATEPYVATGVTVLKRIHDLFPKTSYGRWSQVEAAKVILSATSHFPDATREARALFDAALKNYDDLINDVTIEWFEPYKAVWAWSQLGTMYEIRSQYLESMEDLQSASRTIAEIPKRFKALPQEVEMARRWQERVAAKIHIAETSPEHFWEQIRLIRAGIIPGATEEAVAAEGQVQPATAAAQPAAATGQAAIPSQASPENKPESP